jgi:hypothetical protein
MENLEKIIKTVERRPRIVANYIFWRDENTDDDGIDVLQVIDLNAEQSSNWILTGTLYTKTGKQVRIKEMNHIPVQNMMVKIRLETQVLNKTMSVDLGAREVLAHRANLERDVGEIVLGEEFVVSNRVYEKSSSVIRYNVNN